MSSEIRTVVVSKPLHRPRGCEEGEELPWNEEGGGGGGHDEYYDGPELNLMMICCEENEPYGPALDTATMFLELLCASYERYRHHREDDDDDKIDDDNDASSNYSEQRPKGVVEEDEDEDEDGAGAGGDAKPLLLRRIRITVYHAQRMDYPQSDAEWDGYDGIIIPGSLSAAYDAHVGWIRRLLNVIRTEIHDKRRKTMGVCFGHQCFAHSFRYPPPSPSADDDDDYSDRHRGDDTGGTKDGRGESTVRDDGGSGSGSGGGGLATVCSIGPVAGRRAFRLTAEGELLLGGGGGGGAAAEAATATTCRGKGEDHVTTLRYDRGEKTSKRRSSSSVPVPPPPPKEHLEMLYTRGDMVISLPSVGISLCGDGDLLPCEACAYFASEEDALRFRNGVADAVVARRNDNPPGMEEDVPASSGGGQKSGSTAMSWPQPYAITYQAHPEYMSDTGYRVNYLNTVRAMEDRGSISRETSRRACEDAELNYDTLLESCLDATISTGVILGWFK